MTDALRGYYLRKILLLIFLSTAQNLMAQEVEVIKSDQLFQMIDHCNDKSNIKVYNFWATWCAPCIREIPQFEKVNDVYSNVDVILISIDDVDLLNKKVKPFISKKNIKSKVKLLDETDFNEIIDNVDQSWSGAIPATLIVDCRNGNKKFIEKEFKEGELEKTIKNLINRP